MKNITNSIKEFKPVAVEDKGVIITGADNLDVLKTIPDNTVDMIYIDPPYLTNKVWKRTVGLLKTSLMICGLSYIS
jgi:16S rRNA G966 N2-methylase RsmD